MDWRRPPRAAGHSPPGPSRFTTSGTARSPSAGRSLTILPRSWSSSRGLHRPYDIADWRVAGRDGHQRSIVSAGPVLAVVAVIESAIRPRPAEMRTGAAQSSPTCPARRSSRSQRCAGLPRWCCRTPSVDYTARRGMLVGFAPSALLVGLVRGSDQPGELLEPVLAEQVPEPGIRLGRGVSPGHRPSSVTLADLYGGPASLRRPPTEAGHEPA